MVGRELEEKRNGGEGLEEKRDGGEGAGGKALGSLEPGGGSSRGRAGAGQGTGRCWPAGTLLSVGREREAGGCRGRKGKAHRREEKMDEGADPAPHQ